MHLLSHTSWNQLVLMTCQPYQRSFSINFADQETEKVHVYIHSVSISSYHPPLLSLPSPFPPLLPSLLILLLFCLESNLYIAIMYI